MNLNLHIKKIITINYKVKNKMNNIKMIFIMFKINKIIHYDNKLIILKINNFQINL